MDFFGQQQSRRDRSLMLMGGFVAALLAFALVINLTVGYLSSLVYGEPFSLFNPGLLARCVIGIFWFVMLFIAFAVWLDVRSGGDTLARRYRARRVQTGTMTRPERAASDMVLELAIAAQVPPPELYVLDHQDAINAFVLGSSRGDETILVLTEGALHRLDEPSLRAVIAHEISHISAGDIPYNMRMLVAVSGLNALADFGRWLRSSDGDEPALPLALAGYVVNALGSLGSLSGSLLRAAYSRQREFLADATAVQLTRDPRAMAQALSAIQADTDADRVLHLTHQAELTHLCFQASDYARFWNSWMSTHPSLEARIQAVDPQFAAVQKHRLKRGMPTHLADLTEQQHKQLGRATTDASDTQTSLSIEAPGFVGLALGAAAVADWDEPAHNIESKPDGREHTPATEQFNKPRANNRSKLEPSKHSTHPIVAEHSVQASIAALGGPAMPAISVRADQVPMMSNDIDVSDDEGVSALLNSLQLDPLPVRVEDWLHDEGSCLAALFALFLPQEVQRRRDVRGAIAFAYNARFADQVVHQHDVLGETLQTQRTALIVHACARLNTRLQPPLRRRMLKTLERVSVLADMEDAWYCAVTLHWIRCCLAVEFPVLTQRADGQTPETAEQPLDSEFSHACDRLFDHSESRNMLSAQAEFEWLSAWPENVRDAVLARCQGQSLSSEPGVMELCAAALDRPVSNLARSAA